MMIIIMMMCSYYVYMYRYKDDIALMAKMGIKHYRLSLAWSRILPNGTGEVSTTYHVNPSPYLPTCLPTNQPTYHWSTPRAWHSIPT